MDTPDYPNGDSISKLTDEKIFSSTPKIYSNDYVNQRPPHSPLTTKNIENDIAIVDGKYAKKMNESLNGLDKTATGRSQLNSDSSYSIDILSGGESECESLRKRRPGQNDTLDRLIKPSGVSNGITANEYAQTGTETLESKHRRCSTDKTFYIAKELLMTERTYKKDLEVITTWLRDGLPLDLEKQWCGGSLWGPIEALVGHQSGFLRALEVRLGVRTPQLENNNGLDSNGMKSMLDLQTDMQSIGQLMLDSFQETLPWYEKWIIEHLNSLKKLEAACCESPQLERLCRELEVRQKACYLPLYIFALKPLYRLLHYKLLLTRAADLYSITDEEHKIIKECLSRMRILCEKVEEVLPNSLNYAYLCLLRRDVEGLDNLVVPERRFLRQGCLFKYTSKGPQQRMFFLFSDILVYSNKISNSSCQFRTHGIIPVHTIQVEQAEYTNSFSIYGGGRAMTLSANTAIERDLWVEELENAAKCANNESTELSPVSRSLTTSSSAEELSESVDSTISVLQRSNTLAHVCWHRNISLSREHLAVAMENQLSGYLLRKFKNSHGWQRLWVVFASFCLYFYKACHDDYPLASLPLLGYIVTTPMERDGINKDYVMKLVFKNHVYFFRAESDYTFKRWMEVIGTATMQPANKT